MTWIPAPCHVDEPMLAILAKAMVTDHICPGYGDDHILATIAGSKALITECCATVRVISQIDPSLLVNRFQRVMLKVSG